MQRGTATPTGTTHPARRRIAGTAILVMVLASALTAAAVPATAASAKACHVRNVTRGGTYTSLSAAVRRARTRDTLNLRGVCRGRTSISNKRLTIRGVRRAGSGPPTLVGGRRGPVLSIGGDFAKVTLKRLLIKGNSRRLLEHLNGGGIALVIGRLTLKDVTIQGFTMSDSLGSYGFGAGIADYEGTLVLAGSTRIQGNEGRGAIYNNGGRVILRDRATVRRNTAVGVINVGSSAALIMGGRSSVRQNLGGVANDAVASVRMKGTSSVRGNTDRGIIGGVVTLSGASTVAGNTAMAADSDQPSGAGVYRPTSLTMLDGATISGNTAQYQPGGLLYSGEATLTGVVCAPAAGANVFGNEPGDCVKT